MTGTSHPHAATPHRPWPMCRRCCGIALDMGSARTRAWIAGKGVVDVPTVTFPGTGAVYPIQRGTIIDTPGCARMLQRLLVNRLPRFARPMVTVAAPVLDGVAYRTQARTALDVLRPRSVLTVPSARAIAVAAGADLSRPLIVVDIGAHLTEVVLLCDGAITDARRTALGTSDLDETTTPEQIAEAVASMLTAMLRQDRTTLRRPASGDHLPTHRPVACAAARGPGPAHRSRPRRRQATAPAHTHPPASGPLPPAVRPH